MIPFWNEYVNSDININTKSKEIQDFYKSFKNDFNNDIYHIEYKDKLVSYITYMIHDISREYEHNYEMLFHTLSKICTIYDGMLDIENTCKSKLLDNIPINNLFELCNDVNNTIPSFFVDFAYALQDKINEISGTNLFNRANSLNKFNNNKHNYGEILNLFNKVISSLSEKINIQNELNKITIPATKRHISGWYADKEKLEELIYTMIFKLCENEIRFLKKEKRLPIKIHDYIFGIVTNDLKSLLNDIIKPVIDSLSPNKITKEDCKKIIYVYKHIDVISHYGFLKIGETSKTAKNRILKQNEADNVRCEILFTVPAIKKNGVLIKDKDIHNLLEKKGYEREPKHNIDGKKTNAKSEWFKIELDDLIKIINDYINN